MKCQTCNATSESVLPTCLPICPSCLWRQRQELLTLLESARDFILRFDDPDDEERSVADEITEFIGKIEDGSWRPANT